MELSEKDIDIIDLYIREQLNPTEKIAFEQRLEEDHNFKSLYTTLASMKASEHLNMLEDKKNLLSEFDKSFEDSDEKKNVPNKTIRLNLYKTLSIAASIILLLGAGLWVMNLEDSQQLSFNAPPSPIKIVRSDDANKNISEQKFTAYSLYQSEKYELAGERLIEVFESENDTLAYFYAGISYIGANKLERAENIFRSETIQSYKSKDAEEYLKLIEEKK